MLQILIFKPTLEFTIVQIILDNLINRLIWNKIVEVNPLSFDEWTIIMYLCNEIKELIKKYSCLAWLLRGSFPYNLGIYENMHSSDISVSFSIYLYLEKQNIFVKKNVTWE